MTVPINVQQEGLGVCQIHGTAIMQAINQPGIKGLCFACVEDAKPKTGKTVVVKSETGSVKPERTAPEGKVEIEVVDANTVVEPVAKAVPLPRPTPGGVTIRLTIDELYEPDIIRTLLVKINEGIDNMPPPATIKEAKRIFVLQEQIEKLISKTEK